MSENKKTEIGEEDLDAVAGGLGSNLDGLTSSNPIVSTHCWHKIGDWKENGRTYCPTECKGINDENGRWYQCKCHGTNACVNRWHLPCDNPKQHAPRTNDR